MKSNLFLNFLFSFLITFILVNPVYSNQFNFDITEVEILENGNLFKGQKRGTIKTEDGITIIADSFTYNKVTNIVNAEGNVKVEDIVNNYLFSDKAIYKKNEEIVNAEGNVKVEDIVNNYLLFSDKAIYKKNEEIVIAEGKAKGVDDKNRTIDANRITYNKVTNIVNAEGNVKVEDIVNNYLLFSDKAIYKKMKK